MESSVTVFIGLAITFVCLGVYLVVYSRRKAALVRRFAQSRGLPYQEKDDGSLEARLDRTFRIDEAGCARAFSQVRDIVALPSGTLLRTVELLDLSPRGSPANSHQARTAVLFPANPELSGIFLVGPDLTVHQRHPRETGEAVSRVANFFQRTGAAPPPCPLSVTFMRGEGLAYLEPLVTGSSKEAHLAYLADLATCFSGRR